MSPVWRLRILAPVERRDLLLGALASLGTLGVEEDERGLVAYFPAAVSPAELRELAERESAIRVQGPEVVAPRDWEAQWRAGLGPRRIGKLWIRPSWCASRGGPEIVVDPEQAFGSGEHASTRLSLELLLRALHAGDCVLDVGTGSGILALASLRCGATRAIGLDSDPVACRAAAHNARRNDLPLQIVCGTLAALDPAWRCDVLAANLLLSELLPWRVRVLEHARRSLIVSGLLTAEVGELLSELGSRGWRVERQLEELQSGDRWAAAWLVHEAARQ